MQRVTYGRESAFSGWFGRNVVANFCERQHVSAEHYDETERVGKVCTSKVCSDYDGSFAFYHLIAHVKECMGGRRLYARMKWKMGCRMEVAVQIVARL